MAINRREFLHHSAAAALAMSVSSARAADPSAPPIIDTHQHLWDLDKFKLPWIAPGDTLLKKNYLIPEYRKAAEGLNVVKAIYMEVDVAPDQQNAEADFVIALCEKKAGPTTAAVIGGRPEAEGFRDYITRFKGSRFVKGVRSVFPKDAAANARFLDGLRLLGDLGFCYDLLLGSEQMLDAAKVVDACPNTRFILDHCGNASTSWFGRAAEKDPARMNHRRTWRDGMAALADKRNVICKISGVAESGAVEDANLERIAPIINHCILRFGEDRIIFASNWPVCLKAVTFADWVEMLRELIDPRGEAFARKLFHDNVEKFYGLG